MSKKKALLVAMIGGIASSVGVDRVRGLAGDVFAGDAGFDERSSDAERFSCICAAAYEGCPGAKNKVLFDAVCVGNAEEYAYKGACSYVGETNKQLAPMLREDGE